MGEWSVLPWKIQRKINKHGPRTLMVKLIYSLNTLPPQQKYKLENLRFCLQISNHFSNFNINHKRMQDNTANTHILNNDGWFLLLLKMFHDSFNTGNKLHKIYIEMCHTEVILVDFFFFFFYIFYNFCYQSHRTFFSLLNNSILKMFAKCHRGG